MGTGETIAVPDEHPLAFFANQNKNRLAREGRSTQWVQVAPAQINLNMQFAGRKLTATHSQSLLKGQKGATEVNSTRVGSASPPNSRPNSNLNSNEKLPARAKSPKADTGIVSAAIALTEFKLFSKKNARSLITHNKKSKKKLVKD